MMNILIVLAHPERQSFNAAMFQSAIKTLEDKGHKVKTSDLYRMNFNPASNRQNFKSVKDNSVFKQQAEELYATEVNGFVPELNLEHEKVVWCDLIILQFPLWWFSFPAILKGWVDRVFSMGKFYNNGQIYEAGMLKGKKALMSITAGGPEKNYVATKYGSIEEILFPIQRGILEFVGFNVLPSEVNFSIERITEEERKVVLEKWKNRLKNL